MRDLDEDEDPVDVPWVVIAIASCVAVSGVVSVVLVAVWVVTLVVRLWR